MFLVQKNEALLELNHMTKRIQLFFILVTIFASLNTGKAQSTGGLSFQAGLSYGMSKEPALTRSGQGHYGWCAGADARLFGGDIYFLIGGQYHKTSLFSTEKPDFFKTDMDVIMGRMGMGFSLVRLGYQSYLRTKVLASINFIAKGPDPKTAFPNAVSPANINDSYFGGVTGIGWTKGRLDLDLEFQYGILNSVFGQPKTTFNYFTLLCGINI